MPAEALALSLSRLPNRTGAEVTGVDGGKKLDVVHSIGVDNVIDHLEEDFTKSTKTYDVIFDTVGRVHSPVA